MNPEPAEDPAFLAHLYQLFRDYFRRAEKKRRWSVDDDIPWDGCNPHLTGVVADVIETFCAVELYLPDYLSKLIPQVRANRGRAWFMANWGYEECKHSMALGDWLLKSRQRSDEQMSDLEASVFKRELVLPSQSPLAMLCYTMMQELATWVNYCQLRRFVQTEGGDAALERILTLISIDERAHYDFFRKLVSLYLERDRPAVLGHLYDVIYHFHMPALDLLIDGRRRIADIRAMKIFNEEIFYFHVAEPALAALGVTKGELKSQRGKRDFVLRASA